MAAPGVAVLTGAVRHYAWGSQTAIQQLIGRAPDGEPIAELWFGAHPGDPSATDGTTLDALIAANPVQLLGPDVVERFGPQLPFLLKILAADRALSIQVHPTVEQARAGFARENAAGLAPDSLERNYRDANHKPELLCALTPFEALCGFRPVAETLALLAELDVPELAFVADRLRGPDPLRAAFTALLTYSDPDPVVAALARRVADATDGPLHAVRLAVEDFPGDIGAALTLLLNHLVLAPGEAIYLGAGSVHVYLRGTGVEVMASSDNVLRCGLTTKHIDVDELLAVTDFSELAEPRWQRTGHAFTVPVPDFQLVALDDGDELDYVLPASGPSIVLCTTGTVHVTAMTATSNVREQAGARARPDAGRVAITPGTAAFVPAATAVTVSGHGVAFVARPASPATPVPATS